LSSLAHVRGRIAAVGGAIVLLLVAGIWIALNHASGQPAGAATPPARHTTQTAEVPLTLVSVTPASHASGANGAGPIVIQFSTPLASDSPMPTIKPRIAGSWQGGGTDTLKFVPSGAFRQYTRVTVTIPGGTQGVRSARGALLVQTAKIHFKVGSYQPQRLDQLLAQLGYLPLTWTPAAGVTPPAATDATGQIAAAFSPPQGQFSWDSGYPSELQNFWQNGSLSSLIVKGAVMAFEADHAMTMDGDAGPLVWKALLRAVAAGQNNPHGYTYAIAREANPETLTIWHDGHIVQHSLANTGISAAPTTIGTAPVYLRFRNQIMKGTNPDGSKYADPVQFVAYFRAGEAVHYFPRSTYGWPQSLGCVELTLPDAAHAWPYLTYGSLVTVAQGALTPSTSPRA
jgi:hypothetical protein